jgi:hypothetical protein
MAAPSSSINGDFMSIKSERQRYISKGGYVMGSHRAAGVDVWLHPEQAEPYLGSILDAAPDDETSDRGAPTTVLAPPAQERQRIGGSVNPLKQ